MQVPFLLIGDSEHAKKLRIQTNRLTIGRHPQNEVALDDHQASRFHAEIVGTPQGWLLRDLQSSNGTRLNGERTMEAMLKSGDVVGIGNTRIQFVDPEAANSAAGGAAAGVGALVEEATFDEPLSPEDVLVHMAASLSPGFYAYDIILLNARGQIALPPPVGKKPAPEAGEPQMLLRLMLLICAACGASDIHIEPREKDSLVRIRVDGTMVDVCTLDLHLALRLLSMIKVLCDLDIAHKMNVQESHFSARMPRGGLVPEGQSEAEAGLRRADYRISYVPGVFGQKLVIRVQDASHAPAKIENLLLPDWMLQDLRYAINLDSGMVLLSGPTGSGKTTTLYAMLRSIDVTQSNVVTIENPVEIQIPGITQLPVEEAQGKTFLTLLKSVLRQDPDIILVGEIRDDETARTAMQAAITGHLVFSTLHTKDTFGTIYRLLDLGVEPFLLAQALATVVAQRLVRKLCVHCKRPVDPTPEQARRLATLGAEVKKIYEPAGCEKCFGIGFAGRQAIFELLTVTEPMRDAISRGKSLGEIAEAATGGKFVKLIHTGYQLVAEGVSSFDDVERVVGR